jgi:hypothetical protein
MTEQKVEQSRYVKILDATMVHHGFIYVEGKNVDLIKFNPTGTCKAGGLYFCEFDKFPIYIGYGTLIADVVPEGDVYAEEDKFKAPILHLSNIRKITDLLNWNDEKFCMSAVRQNGYALQYVKEQTEQICLAAVKQYGYALVFVKNQTEDICLAAVRHNGIQLQYVKNQTEDIYLAAINQNRLAEQYIKEQTNRIFSEVID